MLGTALRLSHQSRGMVTADVVESSYNAVMACHEQHRFAGNVARNVAARFAKLVGAADHLPGQGEDGPLFQFENAWI
jgi:hypothetical protein